MNRLLQKNEKRLDKYQEGQRHVCSFCGQSCLSDRSSFNMLSKRRDKDGNQIPEAAICDSCLDRGFFAKVLSKVYKIQEEEWIFKKREMEAKVIGLPGTVKMKRLAVEMALQIAKRSHARLSANASEAPLRFYVKGSEPEIFARLLAEAAHVNGNRVVATTFSDFESAKKELLYKSLNQKLIMEHGVIFVLDGIVTSSEDCSVVSIGGHGQVIDLDGDDQLELS